MQLHIFNNGDIIFYMQNYNTAHFWRSPDRGNTVIQNDVPDYFYALQIRPDDEAILACDLYGVILYHSLDRGVSWIAGPPAT